MMKTFAEAFRDFMRHTNMPVNDWTQASFYAGALVVIDLLRQAEKSAPSDEIAALRMFDLEVQLHDYFHKLRDRP